MLLNEEIRNLADAVNEGQEDSEFLIAFAHAVEKRVTTELEEKNDVWKTQARVAIENLAGQTWIWQGDGYDNLESMSNSMIVTIRADRLKELIQSRSNQVDNLASALGECILASGIVSEDKTGFSGPELLLLAKDLKELLLQKQQPVQQYTSKDATSVGQKVAEWLGGECIKHRADNGKPESWVKIDCATERLGYAVLSVLTVCT